MLTGADRLPMRIAGCIAIALAARYVEFDVGGVFLIPAIYLWSIQRQTHTAVLALVLFLMTAWLNASLDGLGGLMGTLAAAPIAWIVRWVPVKAPRLQLAFYLVYPLHLALIGALKAVA
jgi:hypothetical protein